MQRSELIAALKEDQLSAYARLRGGFPLPLAGGIYWLFLALVGMSQPIETWFPFALFGSGAIFPIGLLIAKLTNHQFMKDQQASGGVVLPALIGMLLFWPMLVIALQVEPQLGVLILAIGMSMHWPVIGWSYQRTALFSAHSIVRAILVVAIWLWLPDARLTLLPASVAFVYFITVVIIWVDSGRVGADFAE